MRGPLRAAWMVASLALTLGVLTAAGALLGDHLDRRWGTGPWLTLVGTLAGLAAGFYEVISIVSRMETK